MEKIGELEYIMEDWKEIKLGDLATVKGGKRLPKGSNLTTQRNSHPYIRIRDLGKSKILQLNSEYEYVDDETQKTISRYITNKGDVLISIVGTIGLIGIVGDSLDNANLTEKCVKLVDLHGVDTDYLYYYLISEIGQNEITRGTVGAVQPKLPIKNIQDININLPPLPTQQKIAQILSSLDDKIELNNKINANLEQQAQALFKSWFVDFEPFGGEMPAGWKEGKLGEFVEIKRGGSPRPIQNFMADEGLRWLKISDVTSLSAPFVLKIAEHIKEEGLSKTVFLKAGSLVLSNSATPGIPKIIDLDTCIHDGWLYFPKSQLSNEYLYLLFKEIRPKLVSLGNGSIFTNLKTDILKNFEVCLPPSDILNQFQSIVHPIFEKMLCTQREIKQIETIRDTLLPKLMNGEIGSLI